MVYLAALSLACLDYRTPLWEEMEADTGKRFTFGLRFHWQFHSNVCGAEGRLFSQV